MKTKGKVFLILLFFIILIITAGAYYCYSQISALKPLQDSDETVRFEVPMGTSTFTIAQQLQEKGLIKNAKFFYYFVRYPKLMNIVFSNEQVPDNFVLKSGIYHLNYGMNYVQVNRNI